VENGVGKLTAPEKGAPNVSPGKRAWRTPIPHLSLSDRKVGQGLIVVCRNLFSLTPRFNAVGWQVKKEKPFKRFFSGRGFNTPLKQDANESFLQNKNTQCVLSFFALRDLLDKHDDSSQRQSLVAKSPAVPPSVWQ
jgi:hypothetical protein